MFYYYYYSYDDDDDDYALNIFVVINIIIHITINSVFFQTHHKLNYTTAYLYNPDHNMFLNQSRTRTDWD